MRAHFTVAALWQPEELDYLRWRAWAEAVFQDRVALERTYFQLFEAVERDGRGLPTWTDVSANLASGLTPGPAVGRLAGPPAAETIRRREAARRAAVVVRTIVVFPVSGPGARNCLALARRAADEAPQSWERRELLGAALYRAGEYQEAVRELDEAVRLRGYGSVWTIGFLRLARSRLPRPEDEKRPPPPTETWEDVLTDLLLRQELEKVKPVAAP